MQAGVCADRLDRLLAVDWVSLSNVGPADTKTCPDGRVTPNCPMIQGRPIAGGRRRWKSGSVSSLTAEKFLLIVLIATRATTPLSSKTVKASIRTTTTPAETRGRRKPVRADARENALAVDQLSDLDEDEQETTEPMAVSGWSQNPRREHR